MKPGAVFTVPSGLITVPPPKVVASEEPRLLDEVATENSCEPFTASVEVFDNTPAATLVIWRSAPDAPTETTEAILDEAAAVPPVRSNVPVLTAPEVEPEPRATSAALVAVAPLPMATPLLALDTATGPMATLSVPVAVESASTELVWKYFAPVLLILPMFVVLASTCVATANSSEPLMASVEVALMAPAATLVSVRSLVEAPMLTVAVGAVPAKPVKVDAPTVAVVVATAAATVELSPMPTEPSSPLAMVMALPMAKALSAATVLLLPTA